MASTENTVETTTSSCRKHRMGIVPQRLPRRPPNRLVGKALLGLTLVLGLGLAPDGCVTALDLRPQWPAAAEGALPLEEVLPPQILGVSLNHHHHSHHTAGGRSLEDVWNSEILLAQQEAERLLQAFDMSVPTRQPIPNIPTAPSPRPAGSGPPANPPARAPSQSPVTAPTASGPPVPGGVPTSPPAGSGGPTLGPDSCLNGRTRDEYLLDQLSLITNQTLLLDTATPQGQAYAFMTEGDALAPNVCVYPTLDQRYGLATLYYATNGADWTAQQGWLDGIPECEWGGIACEFGRVSNLTLCTCGTKKQRWGQSWCLVACRTDSASSLSHTSSHHCLCVSLSILLFQPKTIWSGPSLTKFRRFTTCNGSPFTTTS